jgi:Family of unknown function (DUF5343)
MLPTAYLTSTRNTQAILTAIQQGQAPTQFTQRFLEGLGFKTNADRLIIGVLKGLGFLDASGKPTQRYYEYLNQAQSGRVLAEALRDAYSELYQLSTKAHELPRAELKGKMKTLTQGQYSDSVLDKMAMTFVTLAKHADFSGVDRGAPRVRPQEQQQDQIEAEPGITNGKPRVDDDDRVTLGGLVYNIELHLPESRDPAVYDVLFRSLRTHLLRQ